MHDARPFRDLCPEATDRDAMDEGEFWEHVARNLGANVGEPDDMPPDAETTNQTTPCPLCGEHGACGYDSEGRPMIHALDADCPRCGEARVPGRDRLWCLSCGWEDDDAYA